jgi:hypothetical protein
MSDLVAFYRARLDEDEANIASVEEALMYGGDDVVKILGTPMPVAELTRGRAVWELEAKRQILSEYMAVRKLAELAGPGKSVLWYREWVLRVFAAVWRDHPDYDEAWRP